LGNFWNSLKWKMLVYFIAILVHFHDIWYILWPFTIFCGHLVYLSRFWYVVPTKIWQPWWAVTGPE
jgi:hypothetical protein